MGRKLKDETAPLIPKEDLAKFLRANHKIHTLSELAKLSGYSPGTIKYVCIGENIEPITQGERAYNFITRNMHLSLEDQADALEIGLPALKVHYKKSGLDPNKAGKGQRISLYDVKRREEFQKKERFLGPIAAQYYGSPLNPLELINNVRAATQAGSSLTAQ
jgi:hypothetical protein